MSDIDKADEDVLTTTKLDFDQEADLDSIPAFLRKGAESGNVGGARGAKSPSTPKQPDSENAPEEEEGDEPQPQAGGAGNMSRTIEELKRQEAEIQRQIAETRAAEKLAVLDQIVTVVKTYELTTEEVVEALGGLKIKRKGVKAKQKYRDPKTGATWSGRGKEPAWIKGKRRRDFLIPDTDD